MESLRDVVRLLKPEGIAAMSFVIGSNDWQGKRLFNTIAQASGSPPMVLDLPNYGVSFLFGPGLQREAARAAAARHGFTDVSAQYGETSVRAATDDWPFLYLNPTQPPVTYLSVLIMLLALSAAAVRTRLRSGLAPTALSAQMFFMGAAFLLIETKAIAELSLLFGSTWVVNAAVFSAILAMVLPRTPSSAAGSVQMYRCCTRSSSSRLGSASSSP